MEPIDPTRHCPASSMLLRPFLSFELLVKTWGWLQSSVASHAVFNMMAQFNAVHKKGAAMIIK